VRATVLNEPSAAATMCEWQGRGRKSIWEKSNDCGAAPGRAQTRLYGSGIFPPMEVSQASNCFYTAHIPYRELSQGALACCSFIHDGTLMYVLLPQNGISVPFNLYPIPGSLFLNRGRHSREHTVFGAEGVRCKGSFSRLTREISEHLYSAVSPASS
jgi:hypothetical protein